MVEPAVVLAPCSRKSLPILPITDQGSGAVGRGRVLLGRPKSNPQGDREGPCRPRFGCWQREEVLPSRSTCDCASSHESPRVSQDELVGSQSMSGVGPEAALPRNDERGARHLRRRPKTTESEPPPVMQSSIKSTDAHGSSEHDACFSSMPVGSWATSPRRLISQSHDGQNSLVAGKNAGNFAKSALFCEHPSRKHQRIQMFADEFPTQTEQGIFLPAQGINSPSRESAEKSAQNRSTRPDASDGVEILRRGGYDNNQQYGCVCIRTRLAPPDRPRLGDEHDQTETQRSTLGVA